MFKKPIALILSTFLLCGCASSTPTKTQDSSADSKDTPAETEKDTATTETKKEEKDDIKTDVFDSVLTSLKEDGYAVKEEYKDDDFPNATIYEAEKGETEYEFILFADSDAAQKAMDAIITKAQNDKDETVELNDEKTQLTIIDKDDEDTTIYVLNDNSIVKGSSNLLGSEAVRENMITWGFIYGEQVTEEDIKNN